MKKTLPLITVIAVFIISCSKDGGSKGGGTTTVDCSTITNKAFAADVNPIIQATCTQAGCHGSGSFNGPGPLTNFSQVSASSSSIRAAIASGRMPQGSSLSTSQKNSVICWIDSGTPNN
jgi:hypothetical protein